VPDTRQNAPTADPIAPAATTGMATTMEVPTHGGSPIGVSPAAQVADPAMTAP
jgi:hypothetical protein